MYKEPKLSDERCAEISEGLDLVLFNAKAHNGDKLTMKKGKTVIDTIYSFSENNSINPIINKLKGHVLIFGLGFGKAVLEACASKDVKSVTVVENLQDVVTVFYAIHSDSFKGSDKLTVVIKDALEFKKVKFDHVFIDFIHDVINKDKYKKDMKTLRDRYIKSKVHFIDLY